MIQKIKNTGLSLIRNNALAEKMYYEKFRNEFLTREFLLSPNYEKLITRHIGNDWETFTDDAEQHTRDYLYRHSEDMLKKLGCWRWKGMFLNRRYLVPILLDTHKKGVDIGGAYGPVSKNVTIVDFNTKDVFGRPVKYRMLDDLDFKPDFIFASHVFEHIQELEAVVKQCAEVLADGGQLIIMVPAYTCKAWWADTHKNRAHGHHIWTFALSGTPITEEVPHLKYLDEVIAEYLTVDRKQYTGDNSIFITASKK